MTNDRLKQVFEYESSGMLRRIGGRKEYPWRPSGKRGAYLVTTVDEETLYLHRLVWQYHFGYVPKIIDHVNGDTKDNRIENLRECTNAQNQYNSRIKANNKSGFKGVVFHPHCVHKPWQAKIVIEGKVRSLGYYPTAELAGAAYLLAAGDLVGEFAYHRRGEFSSP